MKFAEQILTTRDGRTLRLRRGEPADAAAVIDLLKSTAEETRFLLREPEEVTMTVEEEEAFLTRLAEAPRELLLLAGQEGRLVGMCSLSGVGPFGRYAHRCRVSIALRQSVCGVGLGRQMMTALLEAARRAGYEQAELDVIAANHRAVALYESLGFEIGGTMRNNMKYKDGSYADAYWMMKII